MIKVWRIGSQKIYNSKTWVLTKFNADGFEEMVAVKWFIHDGNGFNYIPSHGPLEKCWTMNFWELPLGPPIPHRVIFNSIINLTSSWKERKHQAYSILQLRQRRQGHRHGGPGKLQLRLCSCISCVLYVPLWWSSLEAAVRFLVASGTKEPAHFPIATHVH